MSSSSALSSYLLDVFSCLLSFDSLPSALAPACDPAFICSFLSSQSITPRLTRSFRHINSNQQSRRTFVHYALSQFGSPSLTSSSLYNIQAPEELHQLFLLLCPDFPSTLLRNAARITPLTPSSFSFPCLFVRVLLLFELSDFLNGCAIAFRALDKAGNGKVEKSAFESAIKRMMERKKTEQTNESEMFESEESGAAPVNSPMAGISPELMPNIHTLISNSLQFDSGEHLSFNSFCVGLFHQPQLLATIQAVEKEIQQSKTTSIE
jgi:hypothetical protein